MKKILRIFLAAAFLTGLFNLTGCTITPGVGIGIDFDYAGGEFHARPSAHIGLSGRP